MDNELDTIETTEEDILDPEGSTGLHVLDIAYMGAAAIGTFVTAKWTVGKIRDLWRIIKERKSNDIEDLDPEEKAAFIEKLKADLKQSKKDDNK